MDNTETYISLCSGVGGLDIGLKLAMPNARCVCYVEREAFCIAHLVDKIEQGWLDTAPIWTDIKTFDCEPWRGKVRGIIGGYPCQPFSCAGKRLGRADPRHLWPDIKRLICEIRPDWCSFENVAGHLRLGFDQVLCDLAEIGYDAVWTVIAAGDVGATHQRKRLFVLTYHQQSRWKASRQRCDEHSGTESEARSGKLGNTNSSSGRKNPKKRLEKRSKKLVHTNNEGLQGRGKSNRERSYKRPTWPPSPTDTDTWAKVLEADLSLEPAIRGVADGASNRVDELRALGNAVVPIQAAVAFCTLANFINKEEDV